MGQKKKKHVSLKSFVALYLLCWPCRSGKQYDRKIFRFTFYIRRKYQVHKVDPGSQFFNCFINFVRIYIVPIRNIFRGQEGWFEPCGSLYCPYDTGLVGTYIILYACIIYNWRVQASKCHKNIFSRNKKHVSIAHGTQNRCYLRFLYRWNKIILTLGTHTVLFVTINK